MNFKVPTGEVMENLIDEALMHHKVRGFPILKDTRENARKWITEGYNVAAMFLDQSSCNKRIVYNSLKKSIIDNRIKNPMFT